MHLTARRRSIAVLLLVTGAALACSPAPPSVPVSDPAAPGAPAPGTVQWQDEMLASLNAHRAAHGRAPVAWCPNLGTAAQAHSADQAANGFMGHVGSNGSTLAGRAGAAGYTGWTSLAENVAAGQGSVAAVMSAWANSSGHNNTMLAPGSQHVGFGLAQGTNGVRYWTQKFGANGSCT